MFKRILFVLFNIALIVQTYAAKAQILSQGQPTEFSNQFRSILFDVRSVRGGAGDVAAAYLVALDFCVSHGVPYSGITFLVSEASERVLRSIARGSPFLQNPRGIIQTNELSQSAPFDVIYTLGSARGDNRFDVSANGSTTSEQNIVIPIKPNTPRISLTVLGNTEGGGRDAQARGFSRIDLNRQGETHTIPLPNPGLRHGDLGVYPDPFARAFSNMETDELVFHLSQLVEAMPDDSRGAKAALLAALAQTHRRQFRLGLLYGVGEEYPSRYALEYLEGLATFYPEDRIVSFSPSRLNHLRTAISNSNSTIQVIEPQSLGGQWDLGASTGGSLAIVNSPYLPQAIFAGLTVLSAREGLPPVVSGDGALSGAIAAGVPFLTMPFGTNRPNLDDLRDRLLQLASESTIPERVAGLRSLIVAAFDDAQGPLLASEQASLRTQDAYRRAPQLSLYPRLFSRLRSELPTVSNQLARISMAAVADSVDTNPETTTRRIQALFSQRPRGMISCLQIFNR